MRFDLDQAFGVPQQAVLLQSKRAQVIAENIANADTPGYKAKELDFQASMKSAQLEINPGQMSRTHTNHISQEDSGMDGSVLIERESTQPSLDGNTVDTQVEQSAFLRNALEYQVSLRLLNGKIKGLMTAEVNNDVLI